MVGSTGERMLRITLPHVDAWNVWYSRYGNTAEDLAPVVARVNRLAVELGRAPGEVEATAAVMVQFPGGGGRAAGDAARNVAVPPVRGGPVELAATLAGFATVGAAEVQLVLDPITRETIDACGAVLALLDGG
jgi:hypothetical protein